MQQNNSHPQSRTNFRDAFKGNGNFKKASTQRIFMHVHAIESYSNSPTIAFGIDIKTKQKIAVRLTTTSERTDDLLRIYKNYSPNQAQQQARSEYQGSNKRELLDDKRDKRHARFLTFDQCVSLPPLDDGTPFFRSHWSELVSNNSNCTIFEGMAHLYLNVEKNIAILKVIEYISELQLSNTERNHQTILNTLKNQFRNGMARMGSCVVQIINEECSVIAEPSIYQIFHKEPSNGRNGEVFERTIFANEHESLNAFMHNKENNPQSFHIDIDLARIGISVLAGIPFDTKNLCYSNHEYINLMNEAKKKFESGAYYIRLISLNEIFCGPERRNRLITQFQKNKNILKNYTKQEIIQSDDEQKTISEKNIALYIPTVFALHYHQDSGNPFVAYNIISEQFSTFPPCPLWQMPKDLGGIKYRILHTDN